MFRRRQSVAVQSTTRQIQRGGEDALKDAEWQVSPEIGWTNCVQWFPKDVFWDDVGAATSGKKCLPADS